MPLYIPYLNEIINPQPLWDGEANKINSSKHFNPSIAVFRILAQHHSNQKCVDCRLINAYLSEHVPWVLEGNASAIENMLGFETFLVKLKKKTPMQLIIEMLYHWVHSVTFEGSNFNRLVQVEAINKYGISIDADHSLSKNQNTHSLRLLIRGAKTEKLQL